MTGANGFVGSHLVRKLMNEGFEVTCLVRPSSDVSRLPSHDCTILRGEISSDSVLCKALARQDYVFHLAACTNGSARQFHYVNVGGVRRLLTNSARQVSPPTVIVVSSLAAAGPCVDDRPRSEIDLAEPISNYGKSKLAAEAAAREFCHRVPVSIVRPPIVLGAGDPKGLTLFQTIERTGFHLVPGLQDHRVSVIGVDDLTAGLLMVARRGQRINESSAGEGLYYLSSDEAPTYAQLGRMVATAMGREARVLHIPGPLALALGCFNSALSLCTGRRLFFNLDKARDAVAARWCCSSEKAKQELGFQTAMPLQERLCETVHWYRAAGWLRSTETGNRQSETPAPCDRSVDASDLVRPFAPPSDRRSAG